MKLVFDFSFPDLKKVLCKEYKYRASSFQPLPWIDKMQFKLKDVYTKLTVVKRKKCGWEKTNKIVEPSDMFDEDEESVDSIPRIILIEDSPGTGITTLSLKLAYDWAMGQIPDMKFPEVKLVLFIKSRDIKNSIRESAKTQLLPWDNDELRNVLDPFLHSGKIMLIVDGVDEISKSAESQQVVNQTLGRLAYESLIEHDTLYFRESELREDEIQCTNIGFLYKDDISTQILKPDNTYWFLHN